MRLKKTEVSGIFLNTVFFCVNNLGHFPVGNEEVIREGSYITVCIFFLQKYKHIVHIFSRTPLLFIIKVLKQI